MSPLFVTTESRERPALGDSNARKVFAKRLFALAAEIEDFMNEWTEDLSFDDYDGLREFETKLLAFGNLLSVPDLSTYLEAEIQLAEDHLTFIQQRIAKQP